MLRRLLKNLPHPLSDSMDDEDGVSIHGGAIQVRDARLFSDLRADQCGDFCQRVFDCDEVLAIEIDTRAHAAIIRTHGETAQVLQQVAETLQARDKPGRCQSLRSLLDQQQGDRIRIRRYGDVYSTWQVAREWPAALLLKHGDAGTWTAARTISARLAGVRGIQDIRWRSLSRRLFVRYDSQLIDRTDLFTKLDEAVQLVQAEPKREDDYGAALAVGGIRRVAYLSLAGVSFGLAGLGVIVPGLPTVPFLLLTSYYLVRSSPRLNERLLRSRTFGPMIRDWHEHRAMRPKVKAFSIGTMIVVVAATVIFGGLSLPLLVIVLLLMAVGMTMILRIPTIPDGSRTPDRTAVLATRPLALSG